ncbi:TetR/AcrR family transcriptional regulator, partial [Burkholderia stabilis]
FVGLVTSMCAQVGGVLAGALDAQADGSPEAELRELGWALARILIAPDNLRLYRAIVAEAERLPELGQVFYENGLKVVRAFAAKILRKRFDESTAALRAATFVQLVLGDAYLELSIGFPVPDVDARFALQVDEAVAAALR